MLSRRAGLALGRQLRSTQIGSVLQRRLDSSVATKPNPTGTAAESGSLRGPDDNEFNRERIAVKQHAAATSGMITYESLSLSIES